jgi:large subunit ribosomal protein L24e
MIVDTTLTFAARRNVPVRYNRDLVSTTLKAMQRVSEIRARRERVFYRKRMAGNKEREKEVNEKLVLENEHLLPRVRGSEKKKELMMAVEEEEGNNLRQEQEQRMVVEEEEEEKMQRNKNKNKNKMNRQKVKQRLLVGGGVENQMDVD